jgi:DNA-binding NarL/FixJ family response regulator
MLGKMAGAPADASATPLSELSERELEIFEMIGKGWTTRRIAHQLSISVHTIETYRERLRSKLKIKNSVELSFRAIVWLLMNGGDQKPLHNN